MKRRIRLIVLIAVLACLASACTGSDKPKAKASSPSLSPSPSSSPQVTRSTWALYELYRFEVPGPSPSLGLFRRRLRDKKPDSLGSSSGEDITYTVSADGRMIAATHALGTKGADPTGYEISVATAERFPALHRIVSSSGYVSSTLWGSDGTLFYLVAPREYNDKTGRERLYSINADGSGRRQVTSFDFRNGTYQYRTLLAFNTERNELVWYQQTR